MKVKADFVTNSSSASFIMTLQPHNGTMGLDEFTQLFNEFLDDYKRRNPNALRYWDAFNIDQVQELFTIHEFVTMYNDVEDVPDYMKELMINSFVMDTDWGFIVNSFQIDDE